MRKTKRQNPTKKKDKNHALFLVSGAASLRLFAFQHARTYVRTSTAILCVQNVWCRNKQQSLAAVAPRTLRTIIGSRQTTHCKKQTSIICAFLLCVGVFGVWCFAY